MRRRWRWLRWLPLLAILIPLVLATWSAVQRNLRRRHHLSLRVQTTDALIREATIHPGDPAVLLVLGSRQVNSGKAEQGLYTIALAMRLAPTDPEPRLVLARAVYQVLGLQQGLTVLDEYSTLYPRVPSIVAMGHVLKAEDAAARRVLGDADREIGQALAIDPGSMVAREVQAEIWRLQRRYVEAIRAAEETIAAFPDATEAKLTLGLARRALVREDAQAPLEDAAAHLDELPFTRRADAAEALGQILLDRGRPTEAVAVLEKAFDLAPNRPATLYALAQAVQVAGDRTRARTLFARHDRMVRDNIALGQQLLRVRNAPEDAEALVALARAYEQVGQKDAAARTMRKLQRASVRKRP